MALPSSGSISLSQVNTELGRSSTASISLGETAVRTLFGVPSGAISMSQGYGKANAFNATITTNQQHINLAVWATQNGWNGSVSATITIASGVYIWADYNNIPALTTGSFPGGLTIINNGFIMGKGGNGAHYPTNSGMTAATQGGPAISLSQSCSIRTTSGYIGGGGGGGGGCWWTILITGAGGGGGAGGGIGGGSAIFDSTRSIGGGAGSIGNAGGSSNVVSGGKTVYYENGGGGGGRIMPGASIAAVSGKSNTPGGQAGGPGSTSTQANDAAEVRGGTGGGGSSAGGSAYVSAGAVVYAGGGGGGGWGAAGGNALWQSDTYGYARYAPPAAGGRAVQLNGYSVTWLGGFNSSRVFGAIS